MQLDLSFNNSNCDYWPELLKFSKQQGFDTELILEAYSFAVDVFKDKKRGSDQPYITHPAWIAKVVAQLGIGQEAVIAAILHDISEHGGVSLDEIARKFGDEVALLVSGLTEVKQRTKGIKIHQTNIGVFRKFLFSSVDDVRVLIIRIVDRLNNGFTIDSLPKAKKMAYARKVFGIYAPIAEYVGLHYFKRILEDIAFRILKPKEAQYFEKLLKDRSNSEIRALALVRETISRMMEVNNIHDFEIQGRIKSLYSTYLKAKRKGEDKVRDRVGVRVITKSTEDCFTVLGLLHSKYKYLPDEFDDYISNPKPNGYRSIQTTLNWKDKLTVEVQIRTKEMHEFNEFGPASHIAYKYGVQRSVGKGYEWVKDLVNWQKNDSKISNYRLKVLTNYIYVFTPKGDTIQMPYGSTALDFAYRIHTDVGDRCLGAKINHKMVKIDHKLKTGDMVEIMLCKKNNVNKNWLNIVVTSWAREHIKKMTNA